MIHKKLFVFAYEEQKLKGFLLSSYPRKNQKKLYTKYVYILHRLIHCYTYSQEHYKKRGKSMNAKEIQKLFGGSSALVKQVLSNLETWGYIRPFLPYLVGEHARTYKLTPHYESAKISMQLFTKRSGSLIIKLVEKRLSELKTPLLEHLYHLYDQHVSVSDEGLEYLRSKYKNPYVDAVLDAYQAGALNTINENFNQLLKHISLDQADGILFSFIVKDFYVKQPELTQRCYSNLCNLKRELRPYILLQGKPLIQTDITNSQPTLAIPVIQAALQELYGTGYVSHSMKLYHQYATAGSFYEALAKEAGIDISTPDQRDKFKKDFYTQVFFSRVSDWNPKIKKAFKTLFSDGYKAMQHVKRNKHNEFAIQLQNLEASVVLYDTLTQLQMEGHLAIPLHDAIYCNNLDTLNRAKELIRGSLLKKHQLEICFKDELIRGTKVSDHKIVKGNGKLRPMYQQLKLAL